MRSGLRTHFEIQKEEKTLKRMIKTYEAPDMTVEQKRRLDIILGAEMKKKRMVPQQSMLMRMWRLARFISPSVWLLQAAFLALALLIAGMQAEGGDIWNLSVIIPFLGVIGVPELSKSFCRGMWELEQSCFFNLRRMMAAKMAVFGIADGIFLIFLIAAAGSNGAGLTAIIMAVLMPFYISNAVYLVLLCCLKRRCTGYVLTAAGTAMAGVMLFVRPFLPALTDAAAGSLACGMGLAGFLILIVSGYEVLKQIDREEITIWNFE